ncbi:MAG: DUF6263 family protein [Phycisphaerales bacterium]
MNNNELNKTFEKIINEKVPSDIHEIAEKVSADFRRKLMNRSRTRILLEYIMESKITRYAAIAAVLVITAFVGAQIFTGSNNPQNIADNTDNKVIRVISPSSDNLQQMYASGDVAGLVNELNSGSYKNKIAAANFLAKIGDQSAIESLNKLQNSWQGDENKNPFTAAMNEITARLELNKQTQEQIVSQENLNSPPQLVKPKDTKEAQQQTPASDKVDLKVRLPKGFSREMKISQNYDITQTYNSQEIKTNQKQEMVTSLKCLDVEPNGLMDVEITFKSLKIVIDGQIGHVEFDSNNLQAVDPNKPEQKAINNLFSAFVGKGAKMKVKPSGETFDIRGFKELLKTIKEMPQDQKTGREQFIEKLFNDDQVKDLASNMIEMFPEGPLGVGDTWYDTRSINFMVVTDLDTTYMLKSRKDGIAHIDAISKIDMGDNSRQIVIDPNTKMSMQLSGAINAANEVDEATGMTIKSNINTNFSGVIKMQATPQMPDGLTIPMTMKGTATVEMIK